MFCLKPQLLRKIFYKNCNAKLLQIFFLFSGVYVYFEVRRVLFSNKYVCEFQDHYKLDDSVRKLLKARHIHCHSWTDFVYFNKSGYLVYNSSAIQQANFNEILLKCEYAAILMVGLNGIKILDKTAFSKQVYVGYEFIHVNCNYTNNISVYSNILFNLNTQINKRVLLNESESQLSIVIVGFDSVSRFLAEQKLPQTLDYLENKLGGYAFKGYTKVGDNTLPNLLAVLTGKTLSESILSLLSKPLLYEEVLRRGYIDCYAADWAEYLIPFLVRYPNYTHYLRSIVLGRENKMFKIYQRKSKTMKIIHMNNNPQCFGNTFKHNIVFEYTKQCIERYHGKRKFAFLWNAQLAHHSPHELSLADKDTARFLQWMNSTGNLDRTVLILMSDHGSRYGPLGRHAIGRATGNLPLMTLYIPPYLQEKYPQMNNNLKQNTNRLTTPFNLHETLKDVLYQKFGKIDESLWPTFQTRGISLFKEIPLQRTCYDASIVESYCPCYRSENISIKTNEVKHAVHFAVSKINEMTSKSGFKCHRLEVVSIDSAQIQYTPSVSYGTNGDRYIVVFKTKPGFGIFQAIVDHRTFTDMNLVGEIDRLTAYGNQSYCITERLALSNLRKFCYCL